MCCRRALENGTKIRSDVTKLKEWFKTAQLDPNDPSNVAVFDLLKVLYRRKILQFVQCFFPLEGGGEKSHF